MYESCKIDCHSEIMWDTSRVLILLVTLPPLLSIQLQIPQFKVVASLPQLLDPSPHFLRPRGLPNFTLPTTGDLCKCDDDCHTMTPIITYGEFSLNLPSMY